MTWASHAPALHLLHGWVNDAAMVPTLLLSLLHQQLFASVAYSAALQLVPGGDSASRDASWEPVRQVCAAVAQCSAGVAEGGWSLKALVSLQKCARAQDSLKVACD
jgi:hypothetical protein